MSQQGASVWNRPRHSHSSSRTPQNRSNTASPTQQGPPTQSPKPTTNVWTQNRSSSSGGVNGPTKADEPSATQEEPHQPINGYNAPEVKAFLARGGAGPTYKMADAAAGPARGGSGGAAAAWGAKPNTMANGQPFFAQLAKQVATTEGGV